MTDGGGADASGPDADGMEAWRKTGLHDLEPKDDDGLAVPIAGRGKPGWPATRLMAASARDSRV